MTLLLRTISASVILVLLLLPWNGINKAQAAATPPPRAQISLTFDDGFASTYTKAADVLASQGFAGTEYATTNFIGTPNYMTWDQLKLLQTKYNWEIGSHSVSHPLMTEISASRLERELADSKTVLKSHGFNPVTFASPFGDYNNNVIAGVARHYRSHRPFHDVNYNTYPYNNYLLYVQQVQAGVSVDQVKGYINQAKSSGKWLVLVFHDIKDSPNSDPEEYEYGTNQLKQIVDYIKSQQLPVVTVEKGLVNGSPNLLPNGSFESGLTEGWTTDDATRIKLDTATHGSYPSPKNSVRFTAATGTKNIHLFSPKVNIASNETYYVESFLNVNRIRRGEVGYFVDEYDGSGNWLSGQYKVSEKTAFVEQIGFTYIPTSSNVKQARLQFIVTGGSSATGYVDSMEWFALN